MKVLQSFTSTASGNPMIPELATLKSREEPIVSARVHNIKREGECRTLDRPRTNTLRKVEPVNYRKSTYFVHTL